MAEATATLPFFLSLVSLYLFIISNGVHSFQHKTFNLNLHNKLQRKHTLGCLLPQSRREKGAVILEMKDRGHCSDDKNNNVDWNERVQRQLAGDVLRVRAIQKRIRLRKLGNGHIIEADDAAAAASETQIPVSSGMKFETLNYVVTLSLGRQNMSMIVDTGSDLTWVQCQPCESCYSQQGPLFQPSASPSFHSIPCNSTTCQSLQFSANGNPQASCATSPSSSSSCNYVVNYGDGSYTSGQLGVEKLSFGGVSVSNNFVFGCGRNNKGLFGVASGLMGLGRSDLSMISQTDAAFGGVFSYCLPSSAEAGASGSLVMGNDSSAAAAAAFRNVTPIAYTRMVPNPQLSNFYVLNLTAINVGGVAFQASSFGNNNGIILIDSGTVITRLPPSIYKAVKAEFLKQFSGYPSAPGFSILDTCFNLTGYQEVNIPTVRMYFADDAELDVDVGGIFYVVKEDASRVCLALTSLSDDYETGIIGNYQQRNQRVIYDTKNSRVGFAAEPCQFSLGLA